MPRVPSTSPATGQPTSSSFIHTTASNFVDNAGRTLLLRGVNLSGSSKFPRGKPSFILEDFWEDAENGGESFIGRPLNIDDDSADVHLARLSGWGFNLLRFPVTWEAIEHEGPGKYDYEFMDYTIRVLKKCKEYGFKVYIDPHQDIWSRFSGGSGAPFWTLAACGINPRNFSATQSAIIHCEYPRPRDPDPAKLPAMLWSTNYGRLLAQTIFTLFFAGCDFAPRCIIDGVNIQDFLQSHYIEAMGRLADRIRDTAPELLDDCVIGWDSLNEPFEGLCGWLDLNVNPPEQGSTLKKGTYPTPAQSLRLGMGQPQTVENWSFGMFGPVRDGTVTIDPKGRKIWADPESEGPDGKHPRWGWKRDPGWKLGECVWAQHEVWDVQTGYVMLPDYFRYIPYSACDNDSDSASSPDEVKGPKPVEVEFIADYWKPHWIKFAERIRSAHPEAIVFVQPPVFAPPPPMTKEELKGRCGLSGHYYDGLTLVTRHWNWFNADALGLLRGKYGSTLAAVKIGETAIRKSLQEQLGMLKADAKLLSGGDNDRGYPTVIGEIGTPFDMDEKRSYGWTDGEKYKGDYSRQERALDASLNGADGENALNWTIWTYCVDSGHEWGDGWNMEDLSLWSRDDLREQEAVGGEDVVDGDSGDSVYRMDSQAVLIRKGGFGKKGGAPNKAAAASSLSLATLGNGSVAGGRAFDEVRTAEAKSARELAGWHDNPLDFLTDGARAVKAFCRPWPKKVVGRSLDMKFDIGKAEFTLVVGAKWEDRVEGGLGTEIFVPLVHYAHGRWLGRKQRGRVIGGSGGDGFNHDTRTVNLDGRVHAVAVGNGDLGSRTASRASSVVNLEMQRSFSSASSTTAGGSPDLGGWAALGGGAGGGWDWPLVDVDVRVSDGRWSVEGQTLTWWYDVPGEMEGEREYVIQIRRRGGVIKEGEQKGGLGICDDWCPPDTLGGCSIM